MKNCDGILLKVENLIWMEVYVYDEVFSTIR